MTHAKPATPPPTHTHESPEAHFREILRGAKLRITQVRLELLELLSRGGAGVGGQAASAQQVFDDLCAAAKKARAPKPDRVTVYRTLNTLVEAGLAHKVDPGDRVFRFSLTDHAKCEGDRHDHEHPHFVCDSCGTVECLEGAEVVVKPAPGKGSPEAPAKRKVNTEGVVLHGTCGTCVDEPAGPRKRPGR